MLDLSELIFREKSNVALSIFSRKIKKNKNK